MRIKLQTGAETGSDSPHLAGGLIAIMGSPRKLGPKKHDAAVRQTGSQEEVLLGSQFSSWQRSVLKC